MLIYRVFLTGEEETYSFDDIFDVVKFIKMHEGIGNGFNAWVEIEHNGETIKKSIY